MVAWPFPKAVYYVAQVETYHLSSGAADQLCCWPRGLGAPGAQLGLCTLCIVYPICGAYLRYASPICQLIVALLV